MFPLHPKWYNTKGVPSKYPSVDFDLPPTAGGLPYSISLGPSELNKSIGSLVSRFWKVEFRDDGLFHASKSDGGKWVYDGVLLNPAATVVDLSLTFDQLGDPIIFYRDDLGILRLWTYDSVLGEKAIKTIGIGSNPKATFDYMTNTSNPSSDAFIFYVRDGVMYFRLQREKFDIERETGVKSDGIRIVDCGKSVANRMQVRYRYRVENEAIPYPIALQIMNPGAELGTDHWGMLEGNLLVRQENPPPYKEGNYWYSNTATMKYEQIFNANSSGLSREIIDNANTLTITWWQASYSGSDKAGLGARFFDSTGGLILESAAELQAITPPKDWQERVETYHIPSGTASFSITLLGYRVAGSNSDGYLDNVSAFLDGEAGGYTPPPPVPPVPPAFNGDYIYMQASTTQFGLEKPLINSAQHDDISIAFNFYGVNELLETLDPTWGAYGFPIFCEGGTTTIYPIPLWYNMSMHLDILGPQYGYLREAQLKASRKFSLAFMYIDNALYLILVINGKKYGPIMPFNLSDGRWTVAITGNTLTVLNDATTLFTMEVDRGQDGGSEPDPGRFGAYSLGALHNMWRQNFSGALYDITATIAGVETHYPLRTYNSATQPSTPPGNDVTIYNHKPANWKYIAG